MMRWINNVACVLYKPSVTVRAGFKDVCCMSEDKVLMMSSGIGGRGREWAMKWEKGVLCKDNDPQRVRVQMIGSFFPD